MGLPINPVLRGLITAMNLASAIKQQSLQQDEMTLRKQREKRDASVQDIDTKMRLSASGAKPLDAAGRTRETMRLPDQSIGGVAMPGMTEDTRVPADPGQTASYGGQNWMIPTRDQLATQDLNRKVEEATTLGNVGNTLAVDRMRQELRIPLGSIDGMDVTKGNAPIVQRKLDLPSIPAEGKGSRLAREGGRRQPDRGG